MSRLRVILLAGAAFLRHPELRAEGVDVAEPPPLLGAPGAPSQDAENQTTRAIQQGHLGRARYESGDFQGALKAFSEAQMLAASPVFGLYAARASIELGRWLDARRFFQSALELPDQPENAPWTEAKARARVELAALDARFPRLHVSAVGFTAGTLTVRLDGRQLSWPVVDLFVDPGEHVLTAEHGLERFELPLHAAPGGKLTVALPFRIEPPPPRPTHPARPEVPASPKSTEANASTIPIPDERTASKSPSSAHPLRPWALGTLTGGGLALVAGAITGFMTMATGNSIRSWCEKPGNDCPGGVPADEELKQRQSDARPVAIFATASLIGGGVLSAAGVTLLIVDRPRGPERGAARLRLDLSGLSYTQSF